MFGAYAPAGASKAEGRPDVAGVRGQLQHVRKVPLEDGLGEVSARIAI